jgi:ferredoxin--NADP+ reductase
LESLKSFTAHAANPSANVAIEFRFFSQPAEIKERSGTPASLLIERTRLDGDRAVSTGEFEEIPCGLIIKAVGHRGVALAGLPFDDARGVIPNWAGRIERGLYCVGWIKRGASGLIGHNRKDAMETVASLIADFS